MEAECASETSIDSYKTTQCDFVEDSGRSENLKSRVNEP
jgi:hypothetical protein